MQKEIGSEFWSIPVQSNDNCIFPTSCIWFLSGRMALSYILLDEQGPDHDKTFDIEVVVNSDVLGRGRGKSKAKAEQAAARDALSKGVL